MEFSRRTDLAFEANEIYNERFKQQRQNGEKTQENSGVEISTHTKGKDIKITKVCVTNERGQKAINKPIGSYITLEIPLYVKKELQQFQKIIDILTDIIRKLLPQNKAMKTLVVGLGNWKITPDSLGPKVVENVLVTRHIIDMLPAEVEKDVTSVSAIAPGVLGITGIETVEIIQGIVDKLQPNLIIAIDSLASRKLERVTTTIQVTDTGITPGSGIGNHRMSINKESLGVDVLAIGVPMVVDAATLANDAIDLVVDNLMAQYEESNPFYTVLKNMGNQDKYALIEEVLTPTLMGNLIVTPKEIDQTVVDLAEIIAKSIDNALHPKAAQLLK